MDYQQTIDRPSEVIRIPESEKLLLVESGIQEILSFGIRNPESWALESGIQLKESEILLIYLFIYLPAFLDTGLLKGNVHERDSGPMRGAIPTQSHNP